ncbi:phospholipase D epsilon-like protein, partial [Trifolium pratense]
MDGKRDTEIAIGCFQIQDEVEKQMNLSDVHAYRMSLCNEEIVDMEGVHLVSYPMRITQEG